MTREEAITYEGEEIEYATTLNEYATTLKFVEPREVNLIEEIYETLTALNKTCDKILEILEEGKEQK